MDDPDQPGWLSPRTIREAEIDTELLGRTLREFRAEHHLSQADLAQILNFDQSYVSKIEAGRRHVRDTEILLHVARQLDLPPKHLGISDEALRAIPSATAGLADPVDQVAVSQEQWRAGRRRLNRGRAPLARDALQLYRSEIRSAGSPTLAPRHWLPPAPLPLDAIRLDWSDDVRSSHITGAEPEAMAVLPLRVAGRRYGRYTDAIRYLDRPALFENRPSYRLLDLDLTGRTPFLRLGLATYFDKLDVAEALGHELADNAASGAVRWAELPFRSLVGDPFDLDRRPVLPAIETLTLRRNRSTGKATFLLHWRDPAKVATAAGIYGLVPAGEFQPSSIATHDRLNDFDMWRNIVREYSEELLGEPERDGSSGTILDYDGWPLFRQLREAQEARQLGVHCLGVTIDPLTLGATILTAAVFDEDVFDDAFGAAVRVNAEGVLISAAGTSRVTDGLPFDESTVTRLLRDEPMAPSSSSTLERAWTFRDTLLGRT